MLTRDALNISFRVGPSGGGYCFLVVSTELDDRRALYAGKYVDRRC
jgi:hypothetical protein